MLADYADDTRLPVVIQHRDFLEKAPGLQITDEISRLVGSQNFFESPLLQGEFSQQPLVTRELEFAGQESGGLLHIHPRGRTEQTACVHEVGPFKHEVELDVGR